MENKRKAKYYSMGKLKEFEKCNTPFTSLHELYYCLIKQSELKNADFIDFTDFTDFIVEHLCAVFGGSFKVY